MPGADTHPLTAASLPDLPDAAAVVGQARRENFPVALRILSPAIRRRLLAVYGFARLVDDVGDEGGPSPLARLDWLEEDLERAASGVARHPLVQRLTPLLAGDGIPLEPFRRLIEANRQDQWVHRYETFEDLRAYCELSATPVGRLVLAVFGAATEARLALSDDVCVALQVVEHLQDVGEDAHRGRVYLPADDMARCGCAEGDLLAATAGPALRRVVALEADRARQLLGRGTELATGLAGRSRLAIAGFTAGGLAALDAIASAGGDVLGVRCRPRRGRLLLHLAAVASGRRR